MGYNSFHNMTSTTVCSPILKWLRNILPPTTLANLPSQIILEICRGLEPQDLLSLSRVEKGLRKCIMSPEAKPIWLVVIGGVPGLPHHPHDMTIPQFASLVFDDWCMSCGTDGNGVHFFNLRLRLCESCQTSKLVEGIVLKQRYEDRHDVPPIFKVLPSTSDYQESGESDFFFKPAVARIKNIYSQLSGESRQQFISRETARASYMMDRGFELLVWKRKMQEMQMKEEPVLSRCDQIVERGKQEWGWNPQHFPVPRYGAYYSEWQKLFHDNTKFDEEEWQTIRPKVKSLYDIIQRCRSLEDFSQSTQESYLKHTSRLPEPHRSLSLTWQQVYNQMIQFFPDVEMRSASYFQGAVDTSLMHARWSIADVSARITISLIYQDSNPSDWIYVPREEVKLIDLSAILKVAQEVFEVLGFNQTSTAIFNLQLACRCGHPSYRGRPLTFEELVTHIHAERAWFNLIVENLRPDKKSMASLELVDDHGSEFLKNKVHLYNARYHRLTGSLLNMVVEPPAGELEPWDFPCCVHCYRLAGQLIPVSFSEAHYHMKKHRQAMALDCDRVLGRLLIENRPAVRTVYH